jgi:hypothetical protein
VGSNPTSSAKFEIEWVYSSMFLQGRLAQLVERNIDVVDARGSSPLSPTIIKYWKKLGKRLV